MIISASRRTDLPAFYAEWFMNRIRAGYCAVPNPFNRGQVSTVSLKPEDVDVIVFWTRNPRPLFPHFSELDQRGYRYYVQYTLMNNPCLMDRKSPPAETAIRTFQQLSDRIGSKKVIWRYDPLVFTDITDPSFHRRTYAWIAQGLRGYTHRSVISIMDVYPKVLKRLRELAGQGAAIRLPGGADAHALTSSGVTAAWTREAWFGDLMRALVETAHANGMQVVSCAEEVDLAPFGIRPGKCIDDEYIREAFGLDVTHAKDPSQRRACGCVVSKDIGMYDSCLFGCQYCYAVGSFARAKQNYDRHEPQSPCLLGRSGGPT